MIKYCLDQKTQRYIFKVDLSFYVSIDRENIAKTPAPMLETYIANIITFHSQDFIKNEVRELLSISEQLCGEENK